MKKKKKKVSEGVDQYLTARFVQSDIELHCLKKRPCDSGLSA